MDVLTQNRIKALFYVIWGKGVEKAKKNMWSLLYTTSAELINLLPQVSRSLKPLNQPSPWKVGFIFNLKRKNWSGGTGNVVPFSQNCVTKMRFESLTPKYCLFYFIECLAVICTGFYITTRKVRSVAFLLINYFQPDSDDKEIDYYEHLLPGTVS